MKEQGLAKTGLSMQSVARRLQTSMTGDAWRGWTGSHRGIGEITGAIVDDDGLLFLPKKLPLRVRRALGLTVALKMVRLNTVVRASRYMLF